MFPIFYSYLNLKYFNNIWNFELIPIQVEREMGSCFEGSGVKESGEVIRACTPKPRDRVDFYW